MLAEVDSDSGGDTCNDVVGIVVISVFAVAAAAKGGGEVVVVFVVELVVIKMWWLSDGSCDTVVIMVEETVGLTVILRVKEIFDYFCIFISEVPRMTDVVVKVMH